MRFHLYAMCLVAFLTQVLLAPSMAAGVSPMAVGQPPKTSFMRIYALSNAPMGFTDFCRRAPENCRKAAIAPVRIDLDATRWRELVEVNTIVNSTVKPLSDQQIYGVSEYWTLPGRTGDCEDFGLLKQQMLVERGWPRGALLMTVVRDEAGQGHAVLTVSTRSGDFVLDNRQDAIVSWRSSPYGYIKRQSTFDPRVWVSLEPKDRGAPAQMASQRRVPISATAR
jgi:predicted transglutaminase-like cysteine proteinase